MIEEGKEISHDNQSGLGQDQKDFPDMHSSLLQVVHCDTGNQVMEDVFREERVFQAPEVKLEDTSYRVHVMVILVPSQGILSSLKGVFLCRSLLLVIQKPGKFPHVVGHVC